MTENTYSLYIYIFFCWGLVHRGRPKQQAPRGRQVENKCVYQTLNQTDELLKRVYQRSLNRIQHLGLMRHIIWGYGNVQRKDLWDVVNWPKKKTWCFERLRKWGAAVVTLHWMQVQTVSRKNFQHKTQRGGAKKNTHKTSPTCFGRLTQTIYHRLTRCFIWLFYFTSHWKLNVIFHLNGSSENTWTNSSLSVLPCWTVDYMQISFFSSILCCVQTGLSNACSSDYFQQKTLCKHGYMCVLGFFIWETLAFMHRYLSF